MDNITIKELEQALCNIDTHIFTSQIEHYIKISAFIDKNLETPEKLNKKKRKKYDACCMDIIKNAREILSQSALSANCIMNFHFKMNGQTKGIDEIDQKTISYFKKIKKQQMELIAGICDDIEIIHNMVKQSKKMRDIMQTHSPSIHKADNMMEVIRERIAQRPTTLLYMQGQGKKIQELNKTLQTMHDYESSHENKINSDYENNPAESASMVYYELIQISCTEMNHIKQRIKRRIKELKQGGNFLIKLASKGYSPLFQKKLDNLILRHEQRIHKFQSHIQECREKYFFEETSEQIFPPIPPYTEKPLFETPYAIMN